MNFLSSKITYTLLYAIVLVFITEVNGRFSSAIKKVIFSFKYQVFQKITFPWIFKVGGYPRFNILKGFSCYVFFLLFNPFLLLLSPNKLSFSKTKIIKYNALKNDMHH